MAAYFPRRPPVFGADSPAAALDRQSIRFHSVKTALPNPDLNRNPNRLQKSRFTLSFLRFLLFIIESSQPTRCFAEPPSVSVRVRPFGLFVPAAPRKTRPQKKDLRPPYKNGILSAGDGHHEKR